MYSDLDISSIEDVIFFLDDVVRLIKFYEEYHDGCEFTTIDEIECIPDNVEEIVENIKLFLIENYYN